MKHRKIIAIVICLAMALSMLAGCGSQNANNAVPANNTVPENSSGNENVAPVPVGPTDEELSKLSDITKANVKAVAATKSFTHTTAVCSTRHH